MLTRIGINVRLTDKEVLRFIRENSDLQITLNDIAEGIGCSRQTAWRATKRLQDADMIRKIGRRGRGGIRYEEVNADA